MEDYLRNRISDTPILAKDNTKDYQKQPYFYRHIFYRLKKYLDNFLSESEPKNRWIILYGLRGIGKTTLLFQLFNEMISKRVNNEDVLYLSVDDVVNYSGGNLAQTLESYFLKIQKTSIPRLNKKIFLLIDEAHFDKNWEATLKSIYDRSQGKKNVFIMVSGSSAISLKISTDSARRSVREALFPLNFAEYGMLKHQIFQKRFMAEDLKKFILDGDSSVLKDLNEREKIIRAEYSRKGYDFDKEVLYFLNHGGFASNLKENSVTSNKKVNEIVSRIVRTDIPLIHNFTNEAQTDIMRVIGYLASKKPGETSHTKLAKNLGLSPTKINNILDALESTHLIFSVKPIINSGGSYAKAPWKYYFLSPSILTSLCHNTGTNINEGDKKGLLYETAVGGSLFRLSETNEEINIHYDKEKNSNVDFLIKKNLSGEIIPIEVGYNKGKTQVEDAIKRHKSKYGILITNCEKIEYEKNIIKIPIGTFLFI